MGTTLTGTTPQDTYDALIKVTDNGPISGTLKALSDGLGNDSTLSLSTTAASIAGTLAVAGNATFDTNTLFVDAANNRVGIGLTSPTEKLHIVDSSDVTVRLQRTGVRELNLSSAGITAGSEFLYLSSDYGALSNIVLTTNSAERMRITAAGVVELAQGQIKFPATQVPSADANTLDDYEEGIWTPSLGGNTTYAAQAATYTKIGRQVTVHFAVGVTTLGTGSGAVISGLPFTAGATNRGGGGLAYAENPSTAYASINPFVGVSQNTVEFVTSTTSGVYNNASTVFTDGTIISGTVTYFV